MCQADMSATRHRRDIIGGASDIPLEDISDIANVLHVIPLLLQIVSALTKCARSAASSTPPIPQSLAHAK